MRKRLSRFLRRLADRLEKPSMENATLVPLPLEFIGTKELSDEICRRNDLVLIYFGRDREGASAHEFVDTGLMRFKGWGGAKAPLLDFITDALEVIGE